MLPAEGAPLVFATELAHDLKLHIETQRPRPPVDLPVMADASQGGLVLNEPVPALPPGELTGVVHGKWGFDDWEGPRFHLRAALPANGPWLRPTSPPWWWAAKTRCTSRAKARCVLSGVEAQMRRRQAAEAGLEVAQARDARGGRATEECGAGAGQL